MDLVFIFGYKAISPKGSCRVFRISINIVSSFHRLQPLDLEPETWNQSVQAIVTRKEAALKSDPKEGRGVSVIK